MPSCHRELTLFCVSAGTESCCLRAAGARVLLCVFFLLSVDVPCASSAQSIVAVFGARAGGARGRRVHTGTRDSPPPGPVRRSKRSRARTKRSTVIGSSTAMGSATGRTCPGLIPTRRTTTASARGRSLSVRSYRRAFSQVTGSTVTTTLHRHSSWCCPPHGVFLLMVMVFLLTRWRIRNGYTS